jgi:hypothetical protein
MPHYQLRWSSVVAFTLILLFDQCVVVRGQNTTARPQSSNNTVAPNQTTTMSLAPGRSTPAPLSFETQTPLPFAVTTPIPTGNVTNPSMTSAPPSELRAVAFLEVAQSKSVTTRLWWLLLIVLLVLIVMCSVLSALRQKVEARPDSVAFLLYVAVSKNLAVIGLTTALVKAVASWVPPMNSNWSFILPWSYFTLFLTALGLMVPLTVAVVGVSRQLKKWADWEVHLPDMEEDPDAEVVASGFQAIIMADLRHIFQRQMALIFPQRQRDALHLRMTGYLGELQTGLMLSMVSFHWKNWLAVCVFAILNGARQVVIGRGATAVDDSLLLADALSYVFGMGYLPLGIFALFSWLLQRAVVKYVKVAKQECDRYYAALQKKTTKHSVLVAGILKKAGMNRSTLSLDPNEPVDPKDLVDPLSFLLLKRQAVTMGVYRGCVLFNAVYIGFLIMSMAEALVMRVAGGPFLFVIALIPTVVVALLLPWSSLLLVMFCSLGPGLDMPTVNRLMEKLRYTPMYPIEVRFADPDDEGPSNTDSRKENPLITLHSKNPLLGQDPSKAGDTTSGGGAKKSNRANDVESLLSTSDHTKTGKSTNRSTAKETASGSKFERSSRGSDLLSGEIESVTSASAHEAAKTVNPLASLASPSPSIPPPQATASKAAQFTPSVSSINVDEISELLRVTEGPSSILRDEDEGVGHHSSSPPKQKGDSPSKKHGVSAALAVDPSSLPEEELLRLYELNLSRVAQRIESLRTANAKLHDEIVVQSSLRNEKERRFHQLVASLATRSDLSVEWKEKLQHTQTYIAIEEKLKQRIQQEHESLVKKRNLLKQLDRAILTDAERRFLDSKIWEEEASFTVPSWQRLRKNMTAEEVLNFLKPTAVETRMTLPPRKVEQIGRFEDPHKRWLADKVQSSLVVVDGKAEEARAARRAARALARAERLRADAIAAKEAREAEMLQKAADDELKPPPPLELDSGDPTQPPPPPAINYAASWTNTEDYRECIALMESAMALPDPTGTDVLDVETATLEWLDDVEGELDPGRMSDSLESVKSTDHVFIRVDKERRNRAKKRKAALRWKETEAKRLQEEEERKMKDFGTWGEDLVPLSVLENQKQHEALQQKAKK